MPSTFPVYRPNDILEDKWMLHECASLMLAFIIVVVAGARAGAQDVAELTRSLDAWNSAAKAGDLDQWLAARTAGARKEMAQLATPANRKGAALFARVQAADAYQVQHVTWGKDGRSATLYVLAEFSPMPEGGRPAAARVEESFTFRKEAGAWKIDLVTALAELDKIKHPADLTYDPENAKEFAFGNRGGRIVRTEFTPKYTLVILRIMDEEDVIFLPPKEALAEAGETADRLAPWTYHEFDGHPHQTDELKFFATSGKPVAEEEP